MPYVYANGINVFYQRSGSGHPLLLLPALGYGSWFWQKTAAILSNQYHTIVPDPRGSGQSEKPGGPYSVEMLVRDMAGLMDRLHVRGAFVAGHGLGAYVAQGLVLERPDLVSKLALAAADFGGENVVPATPEAIEAITGQQAESLAAVERSMELATAPGFGKVHPEVIRALVAYQLSGDVPPEAYQAQAMANLGMMDPEMSFEPRLGEIGVPTLILCGEHDHIVPPANADLIAQRIPGASIRVLEGVGHLFPVEAPDATADALTAFFNVRRLP